MIIQNKQTNKLIHNEWVTCKLGSTPSGNSNSWNYLVMCALMKMATHQQQEVAHESSDELSSEHSNGSPAKHKAESSQKTRRKRARMMSDSESDGDTGVHFVHDVSVTRSSVRRRAKKLPQAHIYHNMDIFVEFKIWLRGFKITNIWTSCLFKRMKNSSLVSEYILRPYFSQI